LATGIGKKSSTMEPFILSNSQILEYLRCKREAKLAKIDKIQPKARPTYFIDGDMIHRGIQAFMLRTDVEKAINSVIEEIDSTQLNQEAIDDLQISKAKAIGAMDAYVELYKADRTKFDLFQTEKKFNITLRKDPRVLYQVTIDMLARNDEGWWVIDHKTASMPIRDDYLQQASISSQTLGYTYAAYKLLGEWPRGIIYNIIGKTRIRPYKVGKRRKIAETLREFCKRQYDEYMESTKSNPEKNYFLRETFLVKKKAIQAWLNETRVIALQMMLDFQSYEKLEEDEIFFKNTGSCFRFNNSCKYLPICTTGGSITAATRLLYSIGKEDKYMEGLKEDVPVI